jgi:hypothetical protein
MAVGHRLFLFWTLMKFEFGAKSHLFAWLQLQLCDHIPLIHKENLSISDRFVAMAFAGPGMSYAFHRGCNIAPFRQAALPVRSAHNILPL